MNGHRISIENKTAKSTVDSLKLTSYIEWIFLSEHVKQDWDLTIVFVDAKRIIDLNCQFLNKNESTDVISFNLTEESSQNAEGEVYICVDSAAENAAIYSEGLEDEILRLVAHGIYHLLGYDDNNESQKEKMTQLEDSAIGTYHRLYH